MTHKSYLIRVIKNIVVHYIVTSIFLSLIKNVIVSGFPNNSDMDVIQTYFMGMPVRDIVDHYELQCIKIVYRTIYN